ncbi:MAG TPA: hypothetical protein VKY89_06720 [Thermoanaerobaculia bacterium]|nr:hypothetical protein [Thermoanaerobaculia bacterium]
MNEEEPAVAGVAPPAGSRRRFTALYVLPLMLLLAWIALPLARGTETLYMRDVLNAHLPMKVAEAQALRQGWFPLLDPYRGGGQPLAGNPNAVPFYPTNLLLLWATPIWSLNAHFWIHLLLAPFACFWMARRWGLAREPAWAAAVCYSVSGFYLSHLSFYNLIAGTTLAPALIAACLGFAEPSRRASHAPAVAVLWALLLLSGDPLMAALAAGLAAAALLIRWPRWAWRPATVSGAGLAAVAVLDAAMPGAVATGGALSDAVAARARRRGRPAWGALALLAAAFACGTLVALPQVVEFLRILPVSFRGFRGYAAGVATIASWHPGQAAEWLLPMLFGRLDTRLAGTFWGQRFFTGAPPLYPSFYPGLLALALVVASGWPRGRLRGAAWWAWGAVAAGLFCSLGRYNPAIDWLLGRLGAGALRYPVKFWLPVAVGAALLCGLGCERLLAPGPDTAAGSRFRWTLAGLALAIAALWGFLGLLPLPAMALLRTLIPAERPLAFVAHERLRWAGLCLFSLIVLALLGLLALRLARAVGAAGAGRAAATWFGLLLMVHAAAQIYFLRPLYPTDAVTPYRVPPPALAWLPPGLAVVNPDFEHLFGPSGFASGKFPSPALLWLERRAFYEMFPFAGPRWHRRYELAESPEGLDTYLTRLAQGSLKGATDEERLRLLAGWGVGRLVIERALAPLPAHARLLATLPSFGQQLHVYEVTGRSPEVFLARRIWYAPHLNAAFRIMKGPAFDPAQDAVIEGSGPPRPSLGGSVRVLREGPESLDLDLDVGPGGSVLVVQRALLIYRATLDGRPSPPLQAANLQHNGMLVPAGRHRVRMWVDRTAFHRSLALAALGLAGVAALAARAARERRQLR